MVTVKILRYKQKVLKDGASPIILEAIFQRKVKRISLGGEYKCFGDQWNESQRRFNKNFEGYKEKNKVLQTIEARASQIIDDIIKSGKSFTFQIFEEQFRGNNKKAPFFYAFFEERINEMKAQNQLANAQNYDSLKRVLKQFEPKTNLLFPDIDYRFLTRYEGFLRERGNNNGGIINHMKTLRALINEAMRRGYLSKEMYPFKNPFNNDGYSFSHIKPDAKPRALSLIDLEKIKTFPVDEYPDLNFAYKIFIFTYYARGININDIAKLKKTDIYNGRIVYTRTKTNKPLSIQMSEPLKAIVDEFQTSKSIYIFPILTDFHQTQQQINDRIHKEMKKVNLGLKKIAEILEIEVNLTTYVARHTYATTLKRNGGDISKISEALGHSEINTTKAYLKQFGDTEIDELDNLL